MTAEVRVHDLDLAALDELVYCVINNETYV
jgi:hypothetical protein